MISAPLLAYGWGTVTETCDKFLVMGVLSLVLGFYAIYTGARDRPSNWKSMAFGLATMATGLWFTLARDRLPETMLGAPFIMTIVLLVWMKLRGRKR